MCAVQWLSYITKSSLFRYYHHDLQYKIYRCLDWALLVISLSELSLQEVSIIRFAILYYSMVCILIFVGYIFTYDVYLHYISVEFI